MIILGDWSPSANNVDLNLKENLYLCNLEGPILSKSELYKPISKAGPAVFSNYLPTLNKFIFCLANNHIMDYGTDGLDLTIDKIVCNGSEYCGAGNNRHDSRIPLIIHDQEVRIGIIACCETQFGVSRLNNKGVAELGPWIYKVINDLRHQVDAIVVSVHAGVEDSPWPFPYLRELYCSFIDAGVSVVHGHHSHVPQGYEKYKDGLICYGLGNFAVDPDKWQDYSNGLWSLAVDIDFRVSPFKYHFVTYEIKKYEKNGSIFIKESTLEELEKHRQYLNLCNRPFDDNCLLESLWHEVAMRAYYHYGSKYMNFDDTDDLEKQSKFEKLYRFLKNIKTTCSGRNKKSFLNKQYLLWYNMIACESHRQMLATAIGIIAGEIKDMRNDESNQLANNMLPWKIGF